jgi:hypothetical protein
MGNTGQTLTNLYILKGTGNGVQGSELLVFLTLSISWYSKKVENATLWKLDLFPSSGEGGDTYSVGSPRKSQSQSQGYFTIGSLLPISSSWCQAP